MQDHTNIRNPRNDQSITPHSEVVQARLDTHLPTAQLSRDMHTSSMFSPSRHDFGRYSVSQSYNSDYSGHGYQEHQIQAQQLQSQDAMHGIETQYQPYLHHTDRSHPIFHSTEGHRVSAYAPTSVMSLAHSQPVFEPIPLYQSRTPTVLSSTAGTFQLPQYPGLVNHSAVCMATRPVQYTTSQPNHSTYEPTLSGRDDGTPSFGPIDNVCSDQAPPQEQVRKEKGHSDSDSDLQQCEQHIKLTFEDIIAGRLNAASEKLVMLSQWLASSVVQLEMHVDDPEQHDRRLGFWREFNHCWEAVAQRQIDLVREELRTRQRAHDTLDRKTIKDMVDSLVSMCDQVHQFGLVDYEMGIWEDQIVAAFESCLDLMSQVERGSDDGKRRSRITTKS